MEGNIFSRLDRDRFGYFAPGNRIGRLGGRQKGARNKRTIAMENLMAGEI